MSDGTRWLLQDSERCVICCANDHRWRSRALVAEGFVADAAFVDGSHAFHNVFVDLFYLRELVRPGGLIILDDCDWPSVATAADYFETNTGWQREPIGRRTRLRAYRLPLDWIDESFECFRPFGLNETTR